MTEPAIAVLPYGISLSPKLAGLPVSDLSWPIGCPDRLRGRCVGDLAESDHLIVYPKTSTHFRIRRGTRARISLVMGEPSVIHAKHIRLLKYTWRRFHRILTFSDELLRTIPNAVFFPLGETWVPEWRDLPATKTGMCSLIASAKRDSAGHKLRHAIVDWARESDQDIDIMGRGYKPFEAKADGLAPYRYSVVIENVQEKNYFSEKLVDSILCGTVPIYWGCPNLGDFMDPDGIIQCRSESDIRHAVAAMSQEDYAARLPKITALQTVMETYCDVPKRAALAIRDSL